MIHTVKGFGIVNKAEVDVFLELSCFFDDPVEVTNRFKALDLIDRVPEKLQTEVHDAVQEAVFKIIPKKKKCKRQNSCLRRPYK